MVPIPGKNNFDLLRLFAAAQVALIHIFAYLDIYPLARYVLHFFPGVPIFFFISGFLITAAYEKNMADNGGIKTFAVNRILRLYPALIVCVGLSVGAVALTGYFQTVDMTATDFFTWLSGLLTVFQFLNPPFMADFGVGTLNTPLWTISIEIQFYLLTPLIVFGISRHRVIVILALAIFMCLSVLNIYNGKETLLIKLFNVSFLPWVYMFIAGGLFYKWRWLQGFALRQSKIVTLALFILASYLSSIFGLGERININPVVFLLLCLLIVQIAFSWRGLADNLLRRNDYSYGLYIYHMPVLSIFVHLGWIEKWYAGLSIILITMVFAIFSWQIIERPALRLKNNSLRRNLR